MQKSENSKVHSLRVMTNKSSSDSEAAGCNRLLNLIDKGMLIEGKDSLAEEFDVSITTVERWIREGIPREANKDEALWSFHRGKVARWRREVHGSDL